MGAPPLSIDQRNAVLRRPGGQFDAWQLAWRDAAAAPAQACRAATTVEAVRWLFYEAPRVCRVPVGIIGPREANAEALQAAEALGRRFGELGIALMCGGRGGVMEAACKGCLEAGGQPIGLLPGDHWSTANDYVAIPIASGIGEARNAIIARACQVLVAVGGSYGTLSEIAYGLHFERPVLALCDAPDIPGVERCPDVDTAIDRLCRHILRLD